MKAMYCQCCGDIISPHRENNLPRWCQCRRHAVWWRNIHTGLLSIFDKVQMDNKAFVLGLNNDWLQHPAELLTKEDYKQVIEDTPPSYLFRTLETVCIRIRPGQSGDTQWEAKLP